MASVFKRGGKRAKGFWYASWVHHDGTRKTKCTHTTDKVTAERIARKNEAEAALRRDGVIDPLVDQIQEQSQRSIDSHLLAYEKKLRIYNILIYYWPLYCHRSSRLQYEQNFGISGI